MVIVQYLNNFDSGWLCSVASDHKRTVITAIDIDAQDPRAKVEVIFINSPPITILFVDCIAIVLISPSGPPPLENVRSMLPSVFALTRELAVLPS